MLNYQQALIDILTESAGETIEPTLQVFNETDLAEIFFSSAFLVTAMQFLKEEHWLKNKNNANQDQFKDFIIEIFKNELSPIPFLQNFFETSSAKESTGISKKAAQIEEITIRIIKSRSFASQKTFATHALRLMSKLFEYEIKMQRDKKAQGLNLGISFYRTFDRLDEIFNLDYQADKGNEGMMYETENAERVYAGSGVGVQSGYSTVLTALNNLDLKSGDRMVDLGSGYGRVGLVTGLMRPDIQSIGYEYVQHRVEIANLASRNFQLQNHVQFHTCDLSSKSFKIPDAEVYYLYDPFSEKTYVHVLNQLVEVSRRLKITIVTKGNARAKLVEVAKHEGWPSPREFDESNLCLFETSL